MALKKLLWRKYLFVNRIEAETEQTYWNEKHKKHLAHEHRHVAYGRECDWPACRHDDRTPKPTVDRRCFNGGPGKTAGSR